MLGRVHTAALIGLAVLAVAGLAGCKAKPAGRVRVVTSATPASPKLRLEPCRVPNMDGEVLCGTFEVFEDRDAGRGRTVPLRVIVMPSFSQRPEPDPVFVVSAGPGQVEEAMAGLVGGAFGALRRARDIVLVEPRAAGGADTAVAGLAAAAADMAEVRAALGYEHVNLVGIAGAMPAALFFLRDHPRAVRSAVFEGTEPAVSVVTVRSDAPVLFVSRKSDAPATPLWAGNVARSMPNSRRVVFRDDQRGREGDCAAKLIAEFVERRTAPHPDPSCAEPGLP